MLNEEYELLVYDIVYETLLEVYQSYEEVEPISEEYLLERKSDFEKIASKYISSKLKEAQARRQHVDEYRRRAAEINNTTDAKEKKRLERQQQNARIKYGVNDQSKHPEEHVADAVGKGVEAVKKGVKWLGDKVKQVHQKQQQKNQNRPIGLSSLNKQTT